jgi:hypothetical protein
MQLLLAQSHLNKHQSSVISWEKKTNDTTSLQAFHATIHAVETF